MLAIDECRMVTWVPVPVTEIPAPRADAPLPFAGASLPLVMASPSSTTVPEVMFSTLLAALPSIVMSAAPSLSQSPSMVRFLLICNAVPANVTIMSALKVMVSPLAASLMAWRSVPAPLLALLVTVKVARLC